MAHAVIRPIFVPGFNQHRNAVAEQRAREVGRAVDQPLADIALLLRVRHQLVGADVLVVGREPQHRSGLCLVDGAAKVAQIHGNRRRTAVVPCLPFVPETRQQDRRLCRLKEQRCRGRCRRQRRGRRFQRRRRRRPGRRGAAGQVTLAGRRVNGCGRQFQQCRTAASDIQRRRAAAPGAEHDN